MPQIQIPGVAPEPRYPTRPQHQGGYGAMGEFMQKVGQKGQEFAAEQQKTRVLMDQMLQRRLAADRAARAEQRQVEGIIENKNRYKTAQDRLKVDQKIKDDKNKDYQQDRKYKEDQQKAYGRAWKNLSALPPEKRTKAAWSQNALAEGYSGKQMPAEVFDPSSRSRSNRPASLVGKMKSYTGGTIARQLDSGKISPEQASQKANEEQQKAIMTRNGYQSTLDRIAAMSEDDQESPQTVALAEDAAMGLKKTEQILSDISDLLQGLSSYGESEQSAPAAQQSPAAQPSSKSTEKYVSTHTEAFPEKIKNEETKKAFDAWLEGKYSAKDSKQLEFIFRKKGYIK